MRYRKETASDNLTITNMIAERERYDGENVERQIYMPENHKFRETVKKDAVFQHNNCMYQVLESYCDACQLYISCAVLSSANATIRVRLHHQLTPDIIYNKILEFINQF